MREAELLPDEPMAARGKPDIKGLTAKRRVEVA